MTRILFSTAMIGGLLFTFASQLARVRGERKARTRATVREQAHLQRAEQRKRLLKTYDEMRLRYDALAERVAFSRMNNEPPFATRPPQLTSPSNSPTVKS